MYVDGMGVTIIYENDEKQISLVAEAFEDDVIFSVENEGDLTHFDDFNLALKDYIKLNTKK